MQYSLLDPIDPGIDWPDLFQAVGSAEQMYLKFLAPNDVGTTGSHQDGIYLARNCWPLFLDAPGHDGENYTREATIDWWDGGRSDVSFIWYGKEKREYRLTRIRNRFRQEEERYLGSLLLLIPQSHENFRGWLFHREDDIDQLLDFLGLTPNETGGLFQFDMDERLLPYCQTYLKRTGLAFPDTDSISKQAQEIWIEMYCQGLETTHIAEMVESSPDDTILGLMRIEYALFRYLEKEIYGQILGHGFDTVEDLLRVAIEINNRRKSRAGRSLENHLRWIFDVLRIDYGFNQKTEEQKRPDFVFPGIAEYRDSNFPDERLIMLAAKNTCKDRWRQVITEADRIEQKFLFTLQVGVTTAQLNEMQGARVQIVLPGPYHDHIHRKDRHLLWSLERFVKYAIEINGRKRDLFS